jgi:hypothetical protein
VKYSTKALKVLQNEKPVRPYFHWLYGIKILIIFYQHIYCIVISDYFNNDARLAMNKFNILIV